MLVWIAHARRVRLLNLIAVLGVGSFVLNIFISAHHPVEAFYFPYTRFWEFLIGALLALAYLRKREMPNGRTADAVSLAGFGSHSRIGICVEQDAEFSRMVGAPASDRCWTRDIGRAGNLAEQEAIEHAAFGLGRIDKLPALSLALAFVVVRQDIVRRATGTRRSSFRLGAVFRFGLAHIPLFRNAASVRRQRDAQSRGIIGSDAGGRSRRLCLFCLSGLSVAPRRKPGGLRKGRYRCGAVLCIYALAHFAPCEDPVIRAHASDYIGMKRCFQSKPGAVDVALIGDSHAEQWFVGLAEALPANNIAYAVQTGLPTFDHEDVAAIYRRLSESRSIRHCDRGGTLGRNVQIGRSPVGRRRDVQGHPDFDRCRQKSLPDVRQSAISVQPDTVQIRSPSSRSAMHDGCVMIRPGSRDLQRSSAWQPEQARRSSTRARTSVGLANAPWSVRVCCSIETSITSILKEANTPAVAWAGLRRTSLSLPGEQSRLHACAA